MRGEASVCFHRLFVPKDVEREWHWSERTPNIEDVDIERSIFEKGR